MKNDKNLLQDLKKELKELSIKIGSLVNFTGFWNLELEKEYLQDLEDQLYYMLRYRDILLKRINQIKDKYNL